MKSSWKAIQCTAFSLLGEEGTLLDCWDVSYEAIPDSTLGILRSVLQANSLPNQSHLAQRKTVCNFASNHGKTSLAYILSFLEQFVLFKENRKVLCC
mmetsp:Transcript_6407/g.40018  ORF Transcript_6407/g.40018 Transcript_6407/m.40018 type:complete len:97 (+) Transcript_6407:5138-5428(+)